MLGDLIHVLSEERQIALIGQLVRQHELENSLFDILESSESSQDNKLVALMTYEILFGLKNKS